MASAAEAEEPSTARLIKRYANRKLYDTVERRFTSLAHIRELVRDGIDVLVLDHNTGADRTAETLSQALGRRKAEDDEDEGPALGLLSELIRAPGRLARALKDDEQDIAELRDLRSQVHALTKTLDELVKRAMAEEARQAKRDERK